MPSSRYFAKFREELPKVDGKVFAITGTTSGIGFVAAKTTAELGGEVILLNRKSDRSEKALARLQLAVQDGKFVPIECDLQSFASVRSAIVAVKAKYSKLYCLANNAGVLAVDDLATTDGYDVQMQTNHLSHFLLTAELFPLLEAGAEEYGDARVVHHSSFMRTHTRKHKLEKEFLGANGGNLGGNGLGLLMNGPSLERYHQSKLANSVFTYALHERLAAKNSKVLAVCGHPGGSNTSIANHLLGPITSKLSDLFSGFVTQSVEDAAMGLLLGMMHPEAKSGVLYGPGGWLSGPAVPNPPKPCEIDPEAKQMLWSMSEQATGISFDI